MTPPKGKLISIIGCGSASGAAVPPFFVFPGKKMQRQWLTGGKDIIPGTDGTLFYFLAYSTISSLISSMM